MTLVSLKLCPGIQQIKLSRSQRCQTVRKSGFVGTETSRSDPLLFLFFCRLGRQKINGRNFLVWGWNFEEKNGLNEAVEEGEV